MTRYIMALTGSNSTKEIIIELLSRDWPLSARKIYLKLTKEHLLSLSYQATHKALKELVEKNVLEKDRDGYKLGEEWIKGLGEFSGRMKNEYDRVQNLQEIKSLQKIVFSKHADFAKFTVDFWKGLAKSGKKIQITFHYRHVPYPFILSGEDFETVKKIMPKMNWTILSRHTSPMDRGCAKYWRKMGVRVKLGVDIATDTMMVVTNEYIMNVFLPEKSNRLWDKLFTSTNAENFRGMMETILDQRHKTIVTILKDSEIAKVLHEF